MLLRSRFPVSRPARPVRIDLDQRVDVLYWTLFLDVSETELREAVHAVGNELEPVCRYLVLKHEQAGRDH